MEIITKSAEETKKLGAKIASDILKKTEGGILLALSGELGSGKTTFTQGFAKGLGVADRIISPTFIIVKQYKIKNNINLKNLYHIDLYRLEKDLDFEIKNLGINDIWQSKDMVVLIEWAEKIKKMLPEKTKWIYFEYLSEDKRSISI